MSDRYPLRTALVAGIGLGLVAAGWARAQELEPQRDTWLYVSAAGFYDSNVDHDADPTEDHGHVIGAGLSLREESDRWRAGFDYEFARHRYTRSERWDNDSHHARFDVNIKISPRWRLDLIGEGSLKGSAEDRELVDMAFASSRISFQPTVSTRLRIGGAWRHRWFRKPEEAESRNPYVEFALRQRLAKAWFFEVGPRWEIRRDDNPVNDYQRWTHMARLIGVYGPQRQVGFEIRYLEKHYLERTVQLQDASEELRRDQHWVPSLRWTHRLFGGIELEADYRYETRLSNDPNAVFDAHLASLGSRIRL